MLSRRGSGARFANREPARPLPVYRPVMRAAAILAGAAAAMSLAACTGEPGGSDRLLVFAASSISDAITEIGDAFEAETGTRVEFNFGGSTTLARQMALGAPADVVVLAGPGPMDNLVNEGKIAEGTRRAVAGNSLVVVVPDGQAGPTELTGIVDGDGRVALADPALAPAGRYAQAALEKAGVWDELEGRLAQTLDVRAAAAAVASGAVGYGIVYATDAAATAGVEVAFDVPAGLHPPIEYPAAVVHGTDSQESARSFVEYLASPDAQAVLKRHGFGLPAGR